MLQWLAGKATQTDIGQGKEDLNGKVVELQCYDASGGYATFCKGPSLAAKAAGGALLGAGAALGAVLLARRRGARAAAGPEASEDWVKVGGGDCEPSVLDDGSKAYVKMI